MTRRIEGRVRRMEREHGKRNELVAVECADRVLWVSASLSLGDVLDGIRRDEKPAQAN